MLCPPCYLLRVLCPPSADRVIPILIFHWVDLVAFDLHSTDRLRLFLITVQPFHQTSLLAVSSANALSVFDISAFVLDSAFSINTVFHLSSILIKYLARSILNSPSSRRQESSLEFPHRHLCCLPNYFHCSPGSIIFCTVS